MNIHLFSMNLYKLKPRIIFVIPCIYHNAKNHIQNYFVTPCQKPLQGQERFPNTYNLYLNQLLFYVPICTSYPVQTQIDFRSSIFLLPNLKLAHNRSV